MFPKPGTVRFDQHRAVLRFLGAHIVEQFRSRRKRLAQTLGEIGKHPPIFFFQRNR